MTPRHRILQFCLASLAAFLLASCATPPVVAPAPPQQAPVPEPEALPVLLIEEIQATAIDKHRSSLLASINIKNPRSEAVIVKQAVLKYTLQHDTETYELGNLQTETDMVLPAYTAATVALPFEMDTRILDREIPGFKDRSVAIIKASLTGTVLVKADASGHPPTDSITLTAESELSVHLIREPDLRILAINLVKHELINVILEVVIEVSNPNDFPLEFDQLTYDFYGEGKRWSRGRERKSLLIPARGAASTTIPVILNFTEMDRRVFDLVEKLQVVQYRLGGTATVHTGLDFLPQFSMDFERAGRVKVERTLQRR